MSEIISESIHGHEVLQMVMEAEGTYTLDSLRQAVVGRFGEDPRFHTCSMEGVPLEALLSFLLERGKLVEIEGRLATDPSRICDH